MLTKDDRNQVAAQPAKLRVYQHLRELILRNAIDAPHFFTEETVALELGVSRTPVREAFLMLEAEGLLQLAPRKGALVVPISPREIGQVMEVRLVVETWCAQQTVTNDDRRMALLDSMRGLHERLISIGDHDLTALIETDRSFHRELVFAAGNDVMLDLYERLRDRQLRMGIRAVLGDSARVAAVRSEHQAILNALARGEEEGLIVAIASHLERTRRSLDRMPGG